MNHYPPEFSLTIRYKQPDKGSYPRVDVPGFYLNAGWANEGEAEWFADDHRLSESELLSFADLVDKAVPPSHKTLAIAVSSMLVNEQHRNNERLKALRAQQERLQRQIAALEADQ